MSQYVLRYLVFRIGITVNWYDMLLSSAVMMIQSNPLGVHKHGIYNTCYTARAMEELMQHHMRIWTTPTEVTHGN